MPHDVGRIRIISRWLSCFVTTGQVVECRALHFPDGRKAVVTHHNDPEHLARHALDMEEQGAMGVYFTPNPLRQEMLDSLGSCRKADILHRNWLLIDCDPVRPASTSSTEGELLASWELCQAVISMCETAGMNKPVVGHSGNGFHVCYPIYLPNDAASQSLIKSILVGLNRRLGNDYAVVDKATHDAPRIWKLYGTRSRKGEATPERPHRYSRLCETEFPIEQATAEDRAANVQGMRRLLEIWQFQDNAYRNRPQDDLSEGERYAQSALVKELEILRNTPLGERNNQLNTSAFNLGTLIGSGLLARADVESSLSAVAKSIGLSEGEIQTTIKSGLEAGIAKPRQPKADFRSEPGGHASEGRKPQDESPKTDSLDDVATAADLVAMNVTIRWVWSGWIPLGVLTAVASEPGVGKCLGKGTLVLLFDGRIKPVEKIQVGDRLMGPDSKPRTVLSTTKGIEPLYEIQPVKGDSYIVNESHILSLKITGLGKVHKRIGKNQYKSNQIANISVADFLKESNRFQEKAKGWRTSVEWQETPLPIDPYFLGLWLGDGAIRDPEICNPDIEIEHYLRSFSESQGMRYVKRIFPGKCDVHRISGTRSNKPNKVYECLKRLGVTHAKHVPHAFKVNSRKNRLEILAGLLDTDGHMTGGGFEFSSKSEQLTNDVLFLARSLGLAAYRSYEQKSCQTGHIGWYYRVFISGDCSVIPTKIKRKQAPPRKQVKDVLRTGISVAPIGLGEYYGFTLHEDPLFLLGDFTVTHNTRLGLDLARRLALGLPWPDGTEQTYPRGTRTLWVPADNQHAELGTIPEQFGFQPNLLFLNAPKVNPFVGTVLDDREDLRLLEKRIALVKPALVFVDTTMNATDRNTSKPEDAKAFYKPLQEIAARQECAILMITHLNKGGTALGRRIEGQCRSVIHLEQPDPQQENRRKIYIKKSNSVYPPAMGVTMGPGGNEYDLNPPEPPDSMSFGGSSGDGRSAKLLACQEWLFDWLSEGPKRVSITRNEAEGEGYTVSTLYRAKDKMEIEEFKLEGYKWWRLRESE